MTTKKCPLICKTSLTGTLKDIVETPISCDSAFGTPRYAVKVNPDSKVPALDIDGKIYTESLVLIELVNDLFPEKK